jgi:hypothetical protein
VEPARAGVLPLAVEVDGPSHFFLNLPQRPTGDALIKQLAMGAPGGYAAVVGVPHFEWPLGLPYRRGRRVVEARLAKRGLSLEDYVPGSS